MASINNVRLEIGPERDSRRTVTVTYNVCFSGCEALARAVFIERVVLRGDDPIWDDHLLTLRNACVRADEGGCVERRLVRNVAESTLDEDPDTIILGWVIGNKDEVYARVTLMPFEPGGAMGDSNIVEAHFGPAGG